MDVFTAAIAFIIAQFCIALILVGAHLAVRPERATLYWAWSAILILAGVLMVVVGHRDPAFQLIGSCTMVLGAILQLRGLQAFYKAKHGALEWVTGACACLLFVLLVALDAPPKQYVAVFAATMLVLLGLTLRVLLVGMRAHWSFASVMMLGSLVLLISNNVARIVVALARNPELLTTQSPLGIATLYMIPLGGIFLYATGLVLLVFERLVAEKNKLATHDDLTGLLNRRAIVAAGEREVAMAIRHGKPLTVAFVDIDYLKRINDSLGHEAGDMVIADVAQLLRRVCRNVDLVGRKGGDEFCLVFPCAGSDNAMIMGERLLKAVRQYSFRDHPPLTLSIGFASLPSDGDRSWASLIHRADMALYQAKAMGRNMFCVDGAAERGPEATTGSEPKSR